MCDSDSVAYNRRVTRAVAEDLPHVRLEIPLKDFNAFYVHVMHVRRVLREGAPGQRDALVLTLLDDLSDQLNAATGGFLAPRNL